MEKLYAQSGNKDNLRGSLQAYLSNVNLQGKSVLLKPNMVDPSMPMACSHPERMAIVVDELKGHGVDRVLIGDEPAAYLYEAARESGDNFDLVQAYCQAGYDKIPGAELIDLKKLPTTHYQATVRDPQTAENKRIEVPVRDTSGLVVVSMTIPKHHGNYNFSGVTKNLMGLVPQEARVPVFHNPFYQAAQKLARDPFDISQIEADMPLGFLDKYFELTGEGKYDPESGPVAKVYNTWLDRDIDSLTLDTFLEHIVCMGALQGLDRHFQQVNPDGIYIMDGTYLLSKQEHAGIPVETNFAIVGNDAKSVDRLALFKIGLSVEDVPYLEESTFPIWEGEIGDSLPRQSVLPKELFEDSHGLTFLRCK